LRSANRTNLNARSEQSTQGGQGEALITTPQRRL